MSDHEAAYEYGIMFKELAKDTFDKAKFAKMLWRMLEDHDTHPLEMGDEAALVKFGLARKRKNEDGEWVWFYGPKGKDFE